MKKWMLLSFSVGLSALSAAEATYRANYVVPPVFDGRRAINGFRYNVGSVIYVNYGSQGGYLYVPAGSVYDGTSVLNMHSGIVTERYLLRTSTQTITGIIGDRIREANGAATMAKASDVMVGATGSNAGSGGETSLWLKLAYNRVNDTSRYSNWDANIWTVVLGSDYQFNCDLLAGLALIYSHNDGRTQFNDGKINDNTWGIAPYASWRACDWLDFEAAVGYSHSDKHRKRSGPNPNPFSSALGGPTISGNPDSNTWYGALFANATHCTDPFEWLGRIGITWAEDRQKSFSEDNGDVYNSLHTNMTQGHVRIQVGYTRAAAVTPYLFATYIFELDDHLPDLDEPVDVSGFTSNYYSPNRTYRRSAWGGGVGFNINKCECWSGGAEAKVLVSNRYSDFGVAVRVRYLF